jgi:hypothetical protein
VHDTTVLDAAEGHAGFCAYATDGPITNAAAKDMAIRAAAAGAALLLL